MIPSFVTKPIIRYKQKSLEKLSPKVNIHLPENLPLSSLGTITRHAKKVAAINALESQMQALSDEALRAKTEELRRRYFEGMGEAPAHLAALEQKLRHAAMEDEREALLNEVESERKRVQTKRRRVLDELLVEAFAVVREAARRVLGMRHYDIQLVGGMVLHEGAIAEMATGEGKTLVATAPAYLNALTGLGVHIVTVNDYLAKRDREWMGPVYEFLGLSVGVILHDMTPSQRKIAYACDITYGTNNEFGFDYLRDNMVIDQEDMVQRGFYFAIVDEVDSILIDEARTPLIISGPAEESTDIYYRAKQIADRLKGRRVTEAEQIDAKYKQIDLTAGYDYIADEKTKVVTLTEQGEIKAAEAFGVANLHDMETVEYRHHILQALRAKEFFKRDVDYVVRDGQVIIVDEFTGRLMPGRRWSDGLHQAVEAKEGIKIERENQTLASITFQNYFRMYEKLSGMTGTAFTEANEFKQIYNLDVVVMPTNRPLRRKNYNDLVYRTAREKFQAVVEDIADCYERGQPVLVGTISIEKSEHLSQLLRQRGIPHEVLNAKYHEREAAIVAQAGRFKAVTIATNMAGRGTDIVLGGNPEFLARQLALEQRREDESPQETQVRYEAFLKELRQKAAEEHDKVVAVGGLHVIGTERHESRRIDNQLRGRSGRQGDPGSSRFYVSLEDDLMRLFASDKLMGIMDRLGMEEGQVIEHPWVTRAIEIAQKRVETYNFEIRKQLLEYDNVMNKQREAVYTLRRGVLEADDVTPRIEEAMEEVADVLVGRYLHPEDPTEGEWDWEGLGVHLNHKYGLDIKPHWDDLQTMTRDQIRDWILERLRERYQQKRRQFPDEDIRRVEKFILINTIDAKWKDHLYAMDQLRSAVGLRAYGQRDPLIEYKRESFEMFQAMFSSISEEFIEILFRVQPAVQKIPQEGVFTRLPQQTVHEEFSTLGQVGEANEGAAHRRSQPDRSPTSVSRQPVAVSAASTKKVGRNDPCPCGSGKKYKKCCGR